MTPLKARKFIVFARLSATAVSVLCLTIAPDARADDAAVDPPVSVSGVTVLASGSATAAGRLAEDGAAAGHGGLQLQFTFHDSVGVPAAASPVRVELIEFAAAKRRGEAPTITRTTEMTTTAAGILNLPAAPASTLRAVRFDEAGARAEVRLPGEGTKPIGIYQQRLGDDDLQMDVRGNLNVRDGGTSTWLEITLATTRPGVRVYTVKDPLVLPLLAPAIRSAVLDRGAITAATKDIEVQTRDAVVVKRSHGGLAMVGSIAPGRAVTLRIHYGLAVERPSIDLGLRGVVGKTMVSVATIASPPVLIELSVDRPSRIAEHREGRERYAGASIIHPLRRGEVVRVRILGFPAKSPWPGRMLGIFAGAMTLAFLALTFRGGRADE